MRHDEVEVQVGRHDDALPRTGDNNRAGESSIGELFKRLTTDTGDLIRQEAELARVEMREVGSRLAGDAMRIGVAAGLSLVGALSLGAFLVIGLGRLLGGAYWLSALLVGLVMLGIGAMLARSATNDIRKRGVKPELTMETLRADRDWAGRQARELRHDLTTDPTAHAAGQPPAPPTSR